MPRTIDSVRKLVDSGVSVTQHADVLLALAGAREDDAFPGLLGTIRSTRSLQALAAAVIEAKHVSLGGDSGVLGAPLGAGTTLVSTPLPVASNVSFRTASGTLTTSRSRERRVDVLRTSLPTNATTLVGTLDSGRFVGSTSSDLVDPRAVPTSSEVMAVGDGVGYYKHYRNGSIYWSSSEGAHYVLGQVLYRWYLDGATTGLGYPSTDALATPGNDGNYNHFTSGTVLWTQAGGVRQLSGDIERKWIELGDVDGPLGLPTTDATWFIGGGRLGRFAQFQGGSIYSSTATGPHALHGAIERAWIAAGGVDGTLGWPTSSVSQQAPGDPSLFASFENGVLHWAFGAEGATVVPATHTHEGIDVGWSHEDLESVLLPGLRAVVEALQGASVVGGLERGELSDVSFDGLASHERRLSFSGMVRVQWGQVDTPVLSGTMLAAVAGALASKTTLKVSTASPAAPRSRVGDRFRSGSPRVGALVDLGFEGTRSDRAPFRAAGILKPEGVLDLSARVTAGSVDARWSIDWVIEVGWDPSQHAVSAAIVDYTIWGASQADGDAESFELAQRKLEEHLDSHLWMPWNVASLPRDGESESRVVLTVHVSSSGEVGTYLEPTGSLLGGLPGLELLADIELRGIANGEHVLGREGVSGIRVPFTVLTRVSSSTKEETLEPHLGASRPAVDARRTKVAGDAARKKSEVADRSRPTTSPTVTPRSDTDDTKFSRARRGLKIRRPSRAAERDRSTPLDPR